MLMLTGVEQLFYSGLFTQNKRKARLRATETTLSQGGPSVTGYVMVIPYSVVEMRATG